MPAIVCPIAPVVNPVTLPFPAALPESTGLDSPVYIPTLEDEMHESGYTVGRSGQRAGIRDVFPQFSYEAIRAGALSFAVGNRSGLADHARDRGHAAGILGKPCEMPATIERRFLPHFTAGHSAGVIERAEREAEMAEYFAQCDAEWELEQREREYELMARESGGWWQVHPDMVD